MTQRDIDLYCAICGNYMFSVFDPGDEDYVCVECKKKNATPIEYFILNNT